MLHLGFRPAGLLATAAVVALAGCGGAEQAGDNTPVTLRMAHIDGGTSQDPAVEWFTERVAELSDADLQLEVVSSCCGRDPDVEERLVEAVAAGDFELGWVGTRVFADLGITSLKALTAPLLLDSYAVQEAVIGSDIPDEMLAGLDALGVAGLAVLPGALRRPISADHPLVTPKDWQGITFHVFHSAGNEQTIAALGATPTDVGFDDRDQGLFDGSIQGLENSIVFHADGRQSLTPYVAVNVNLWPRISALVANPGALSGLSDAQVGWLRQAASDVAARTGELADLDAAVIADSCRVGARYAEASDAELAALSDALVPVYAELEQDPATKTFIDRIRELKQAVSTEKPLVIPDGCTGNVPLQAVGDDESAWSGPTIPTGTYVKVVARAEALAAGVPEEFLDEEFPGVDELRITYQIDDGGWMQLANYGGAGDRAGDRGTYTYDEDGRWITTSESEGCQGCVGVIEWSLDADTLTLTRDWDDEVYADVDIDEIDKVIDTFMTAGTYEMVTAAEGDTD